MSQVAKFGIAINTSIGSFFLLTAELVEAARTGGAFRSFTDLPDATLHYANPTTSERATAFMYRGEIDSAKLSTVNLDHLAAAMMTKVAVAMDEAYEGEGILGGEQHSVLHAVRALLQQDCLAKWYATGDFPHGMSRGHDSIVRKFGDEISIDLWSPERKVMFTSKDDARTPKIRNNSLSGGMTSYVGFGREFQRMARQDLELQVVLTFGSKTWVNNVRVVCDVDPTIRLDALFSCEDIVDPFVHLAEEHLIGLTSVEVKRVGLGSELNADSEA